MIADGWASLRHGGNLITAAGLLTLPEPSSAPWGTADRLRSALVACGREAPSSASLGALLDVVFESVCGFDSGWLQGNAIGSSDAEKLLDGTVLKPRRRWAGEGSDSLLIFTTPAPRLGVGKGRRPVAQVVEYLRRRRSPLAVLTNGAQWRLLWADADSVAWVEWDADRWLAADQLSPELAVLRHVLSRRTLSRDRAGISPLLAAIRDARRGQARLSSELGERVRRAVEALIASRQAQVAPAWDSHEATALYGAACHFVMRLVVTLFAEARELLPVDNPIYHRAYGLRGLLDQLDRLSPERRRSRQMAWPRLLALCRLLHQGSPHPALVLPAYGGDLFRPGEPSGDGIQRALAILEATQDPPDDQVVYGILVLLTRTTQKVRDGSVWRTVAAPVDFTELTSEYIGILYEGLLDYELHRAGAQPVVFLNLGDQPALPLDRLEGMDDRTLAALVEKAKVNKKDARDGEADEGDEEDGDEEDETENGLAPDEGSGLPVEIELQELDVLSPSDARSLARARAVAWGRRAAEVGKLVKKPKERTARDLAAYEAALELAGRQLVADLKLPGELYLVRWGGTRKGAGTFYTRPQLTQPTVRRTLEPLLRDEAGVVRTPESLLALKICDPAMGSGSFLVAALRVMTRAVVESLHHHGRLVADQGYTQIACTLIPQADRQLPLEGLEERLESIVRRAVVEHCLYGVDLDPLAVELGRVALWIETLDKRLPFTFLDHKLRCGDALVGGWLDQFREYPLLALDRQSPDFKYKGVHHRPDLWHAALEQKRAAAILEQVDLLTGQLRLASPASTDVELQAAVDRMRRLYRELREVPASRPDERARIWREKIQPDAALTRVREAFDTWCALWFWPWDQLDALPMPSELHAPSAAARSVVKALHEERRFLHWELEFPDVFTSEGAGFDAIVGNPPWEIQKPNSREFFSNHDPLYRAYGKQEALAAQRALFEAQPAVETQWLAYNGDFKSRGNFVKHAAEPFGDGRVARHDGGDVSLVRGAKGAEYHKLWRTRRARYRGNADPEHRFRHQGSADLNTYKMFVEVAHALLRRGGQLGLVVPSGLYTDKGTGDLRKLLLHRCQWRWLYGFENRNKLFDIHRSFKFCVLIAAKGGRTESFQAAFMRHDLEDWADATSALTYPAERVLTFSPKSSSVLEIRGQRDLEVLTRLYANGVLLGDGTESGWRIHYSREFHITGDSKHFPGLDRWLLEGMRESEYGFYSCDSSSTPMAFPVYEGRLIDQLDFFAASWLSGKGRSSKWCNVNWPKKEFRPQYMMDARYYSGSGKMFGHPKIAQMQVTSSTNTRTVIAALTPGWPGVDKTPFLKAEGGEIVATAALAGVLSSFVLDSVARFAVGAMTLGWYVLEALPLPLRGRAVERLLARYVLRLNAAAPAMADYWLLWRVSAPAASVSAGCSRVWAITRHERLRLRCMLDAIIAALYRIEKSDFSWLLRDCDSPNGWLADSAHTRNLDPKGFWRVDKSDDPELRHTVLSMVAFDDLQAAIAAAGGDRDAGIAAFCDQNHGDGWMLPETLCIAELGMTRTVDVDNYDEAARSHRPVRSRMGPRFLDWQLTQSVEESWAECERHAQTIAAGMPAPQQSATAAIATTSRPVQGTLFDL